MFCRLAGLARLHPPAVGTDWLDYRRKFMTSDGRIEDDHYGGGSHSEGQAWGMLLATWADDEESFDLLRGWTLRHLSRRRDTLLAWRYDARLGRVTDSNTATDADLYHALALIRAQRRWPWKRLGAHAREIAADCLRLLLRETDNTQFLLPGVDGFEGWRHFELNPSYILPRAFGELQQLTGDPRWTRLAADGHRLLDRCRFGPWGLPSDWARISRADGRLSPAPAPGRSPRFGYDAIRVAMNLVWAGQAAHPAAQAIGRFWAQHGPVPPAWVDLVTNQVSSQRGEDGHAAVHSLLTWASGAGAARFPRAHLPPRYYAATLVTLCAHISNEQAVA